LPCIDEKEKRRKLVMMIWVFEEEGRRLEVDGVPQKKKF